MKSFKNIITESLLASTILCLILTATLQVEAICPSGNDIKPCTCDNEGLRCSNPGFNDNGLIKVFKAPAERKAIRSVWIFQTNLTALRKRAFGDYIIQNLYLDLNKIQKVEQGAFGDAATKLNSLSLTRNSLSSFPFSDLEQMIKLKQFGLGHNKLTNIPENAFAYGKTIEQLDLSRNSINKIEPYAFSGLIEAKKIDLSNNHITALRSFSLLVLSSSRSLTINLRNNDISFISPDTFGDHHPLALDLSGNSLTHLSESVFLPLLQNSTEIDVDQNKFTCSECSLNRWLLELDRKISDNLSNFECEDGTKLEDLTLESIGCQAYEYD